MKDINLVAGIVLYNPDIRILKKSIRNIEKKVSKIYLIDNSSNNIEEIRKIKEKNIVLIENKENLGIAKALNQIIKNCENDSKWVLTLDQDSIPTEKMINEMLKYISKENVSMICPTIIDRNKNDITIKQTKEYEEIKRCITSGTIMNVNDCKNFGYFDETMFIDYVDFDYCKRVSLNDKKIIKINNAYLEHEIGKREKRKFLFLTVYPTNHNEKRIYYYVRNIYYYLSKYKKDLTIKEKIIEYKFLLWKYISIILYEKNKKNKLKMYFKGKKDSKKMN